MSDVSDDFHENWKHILKYVEMFRRILLMINQYWIRLWVSAIRQQASTQFSVVPDIWHSQWVKTENQFSITEFSIQYCSIGIKTLEARDQSINIKQCLSWHDLVEFCFGMFWNSRVHGAAEVKELPWVCNQVLWWKLRTAWLWMQVTGKVCYINPLSHWRCCCMKLPSSEMNATRPQWWLLVVNIESGKGVQFGAVK